MGFTPFGESDALPKYFRHGDAGLDIQTRHGGIMHVGKGLMRRLYISVFAFQFTLSVAVAQPVTTLIAAQSVAQKANAGEVVSKKTAKPLVHIEVLSPTETIVVLPLVSLHLLLTDLIGGATSESGIASVYNGGTTASGKRTTTGGMTAAHRSIPFGTSVKVTNRINGKSVVVRINDRGPFIKGRIIDLMPAAAKALGFSGLTRVTLVVVGHSDQR